MDNFTYFQPTEIVFGQGRVRETGARSSRDMGSAVSW